jgi:hypothetical protein
VATGYQDTPGNLVSLIQLVFSWITPHYDTLGHDISKILFLPETGSIGVFILVPVFLVGMLSIPLLIKYRPGQLSIDECYLMISLIFITLAIFIAYINVFPILVTDHGIAPDMRWLSPVYLSLNLIGLLILSKITEILQNIYKFFKFVIVSMCLLVPMFLVIISISKNKNEDFFPVLSQVTLWVSIIVVLTVIISIIFLYPCLKKQSNITPFVATLGFLIALPLVWQIMAIFLIANLVRLFAGYNFWLPFVREASNFLYTIL